MQTPSDVHGIRQIDARIASLEKEMEGHRKEVDWLRQEVQKLSEKRNSMLGPISRLPPEILTQIFVFCIPASTSYDLHPFLRFFSFSHVCRTWRNAALNCPSLWTNPLFSTPKLATAMVERSKPALIDIHLDSYHHSLQWLVQENLPRIRRLRLRYTGIDTWANHLLRPAPNLKILIISNFKHAESYRFPNPNIFDGKTPLLTKIRLYRCYLPWNTPLYNNVTVLCLSGDGRTNIPSAAKFVAALQRIPRLEDLELENIFPDMATEASPFHLPHLRRLELIMPAAACVHILRHISFPSTTSVVFDCSPSSSAPDAYSVLFSHLSYLYGPTAPQSTRRPAIKSLLLDFHVGYNTEGSLYILGWDVDDIAFPGVAMHDSQRPPPNLKLVLSAKHNDGVERRLGRRDPEQALEALHLGSVETLLLEGEYHLPSVEGPNDYPSKDNFLQDCLGSLLWSTSIKTFHVWGFSMAFHALKGVQAWIPGHCTSKCMPGCELDVVVVSGGSAHEFAFPSLRKLDLFAVRFSDREERALIEVLGCGQLRIQHDLEVPKLALQRCQVDLGRAKDLQKRFALLEWDGAITLGKKDRYYRSGITK